MEYLADGSPASVKSLRLSNSKIKKKEKFFKKKKQQQQ
jgi:hypothetical protein